MIVRARGAPGHQATRGDRRRRQRRRPVHRPRGSLRLDGSCRPGSPGGDGPDVAGGAARCPGAQQIHPAPSAARIEWRRAALRRLRLRSPWAPTWACPVRHRTRRAALRRGGEHVAGARRARGGLLERAQRGIILHDCPPPPPRLRNSTPTRCARRCAPTSAAASSPGCIAGRPSRAASRPGRLCHRPLALGLLPPLVPLPDHRLPPASRWEEPRTSRTRPNCRPPSPHSIHGVGWMRSER